MANSLHQVRFTEPRCSTDKKRVVSYSRVVADVNRCCSTELIRLAFNKRLEGIHRIKIGSCNVISEIAFIGFCSGRGGGANFAGSFAFCKRGCQGMPGTYFKSHGKALVICGRMSDFLDAAVEIRFHPITNKLIGSH